MDFTKAVVITDEKYIEEECIDIKASADKKVKNKQDIVPGNGYYNHINEQYNDMERLVYQSMNSEEK